MSNVRVRFAPSPTGFLHLGSARTALFNWLYARRVGGTFVLRIEDTDNQRSKKEFLDEILKDLKWMGLDWDEGPFFQSERSSLYMPHAEKLLEKGLAYKDGEAIIFKVADDQIIEVEDLIHGKIIFNTKEIKDQVLIKSDGSPAYNFCCVIDDNDMGITHIVRGDDHLSNTPKQILFYKALGFNVPKFAHMPLMMGKDGTKLSKRHGGVAVFEYKQEGFLPEALANYLMLLGWMPKDGKEILALDEAVKQFDISDINNVQAKFDVDKLKWINGEYIRQKKAEELRAPIMQKMEEEGYRKENIDKEYLLRIIELYKERFRTFSEFLTLTTCFFKDDYVMDEKAFQKNLSKEESKKCLAEFAKALKEVKEFTSKNIEECCRELSERTEIKAAQFIHPTRTAVSGMLGGAGLFEMMEVLGKDKVIARMEKWSI
ncbi:MAG: glutamate--tRNA ligase [Candidatus Omnitrophica bacterium]|nr:glutamate--tRNA ligase [Candidatus Omnitrophota bacterium]